jgi:hypothetical protein
MFSLCFTTDYIDCLQSAQFIGHSEHLPCIYYLVSQYVCMYVAVSEIGSLSQLDQTLVMLRLGVTTCAWQFSE